MENDQKIGIEDIERIVEQEVNRKLDSMVHSAVAKEEDVRFRQLKWILVALGVVGFGSFGTLASYIIEKAVDARIESATGGISTRLEILGIQVAASDLEDDDGITIEGLDSIMNYLRESEDKDGVRKSKEFLALLQQSVQMITAADKTAAADEVFGMYETEILSSPSMVELMLHHYGQQFASMESEDAEFTRATFSKLSRVADDSGVPEVALVYKTLRASDSSETDDRNRVIRFIEESKHLNDTDRHLYFKHLLSFTRAENWMRTPTIQGRTLERVSRQFFGTHGQRIISTYGFADEDRAFSRAASVGLDDDEAKEVGLLVSSALHPASEADRSNAGSG